MGKDFHWHLTMKCGEVLEKWHYIHQMDSVALKEGQGSTSVAKQCAWEHSIKILSSTIKSYNVEDNDKFKTTVTFECWGLC